MSSCSRDHCLASVVAKVEPSREARVKMTTREPLRKLKDIKEIIARCSLEFEAINSPHEIYEEKAAAVRANLAQVWDRLLANPHSSEAPGLQREIEDYGGQLKELEITYKATIKEDEKAYDQQLQAAMTSLCDNLIKIIGRSQVEKSLRTLPNQQPSEGGRGGSSDGLEISLTVPSDVTQRELSNSQLHESAPRTGSVIHEKRKKRSSGSLTRQKRRRADRGELHREARDTILLASEHGRLSHEPADVVKYLGVQVLDCNGALADKNNMVALQAFRSEHDQAVLLNRPINGKVASSIGPTRQSRRQHGNSSRQRDQGFDGITDPTPGEVYLAFWKKSKEWSAVLLLPMTDLDNVGVRNTLQGLGLAEQVPGCYEYDNQTDCFGWREGYRDGESFVAEREFPVMYFDGQDFPAKSAVGWVAAKDLRTFDVNGAQSSLVPHFQSVQKFLRDRAAAESGEVAVTDSSVDRTGSFDDQQTHRSPFPDPNQEGREPERMDEPGSNTTRSRPSRPATDGPASLPGDPQEAEYSSGSIQRILSNDRTDIQGETISANIAQTGEHTGQIARVTRPQAPAVTDQATNGPEHATSPAERGSYAKEARAGDHVNSTAIISPQVSPQVSTLAQVALDTLRLPAPTQDIGSSAAVDKPAADAIVDVVDADGNVIGRVERIEPRNQWVERIQELEIRRPVKIRRGRRFNVTHLASIYERTEAKGVKWLSCMIQATGEIQSKRCQSCAKDQGAFDDCIIVGGDLFQKCGNCEWNRQGCHGASGGTIDILASRERSGQRRGAKELHTRPSPEPEPKRVEIQPRYEPAPEPQPVQASRTERPVRVPSRHPSPQPVPQPAPQHVPERIPERVSEQAPEPTYRLSYDPVHHPPPEPVRQHAPVSRPDLVPERMVEPMVAPSQPQPRPEVPRSALPSHTPRPVRNDTLQPTTEFDTPMKDASVPNGTQPAREPEQMPTSQEYRVTPGFKPANVRSRHPSAERTERPTPAFMPIEPSPQPTESPSEEPLEEITRDNLVLRHNGEVYTYPECVEGVPLVKIDESHPYWEPNWPNLRTLIEPQLARLREKHQAAIEAGSKPERGGSSKYQIGQQVNRGVKILEFHEQGPISPYQLLSKKYIQSEKGGITSYDTLFRLSETMSELEKFKLDITPIEWMRQRLHELILAEGPSFNLPRTIHDFYHDPKLTTLRYKHGFKNIGRPSGLKARQSQGSPSSTPKPLKKRKSMHSVASTPRETSFVDQSPLATQVPAGPDSRFSTHLHKRPKVLLPASGPVHDEFHFDAWSDTDSHSGGEITNYDWRLFQVKNRLFTSPSEVIQYWTWLDETGCFQHQVLKDVSPALWGLFKDHIDFHVNLDEIEEVVWNIEALRIQIIMRKVNVTMNQSDGGPRGDVMASFKRDRTMRRFLFFCREKGVRMLKQTTEELDRRWQMMQSEQLLDVDGSGESNKHLLE
ncbi:hypothetical protein NW757_014362 [Fusarium falciforme]|nr:hypothetical protein NW757_014362 [Fusarium falciforme]